MSRERITVIGVAVAFYILGGWSIYGQFQSHEPPVLTYKYIVRGIRYDANQSPRQRVLADARAHSRPYQPLDPAVAIMVGEPLFSTLFGLIGFGTLLALCRELVQRRRGRYRGEAVPAAWQGLIAVLRQQTALRGNGSGR